MEKSNPDIKPKRHTLDPELQTMAKIDRLLTDLPAGAADRVIQWIVNRWAKDSVHPERVTITEVDSQP